MSARECVSLLLENMSGPWRNTGVSAFTPASAVTFSPDKPRKQTFYCDLCVNCSYGTMKASVRVADIEIPVSGKSFKCCN